MPWVKTNYAPKPARHGTNRRSGDTDPEPSPAPENLKRRPTTAEAGHTTSPRQRLRPPPPGLGEPVTESDWGGMESLPEDAEHPAPLEEARQAKRTRTGKTPRSAPKARFSQMMEDPALKAQAQQRLDRPEHRIVMARDGRVPEICLLLQPDAWTDGVTLDHPMIREWSCHLPADTPWPTSAEWKALPKPGLADPDTIAQIIAWTQERRIALLRYDPAQREESSGDMRAIDTLIACVQHHRPQRGG